MSALKAQDYAADFPDEEIVVYRNPLITSELYPHGVECLILVPKARIAANAKDGKPGPMWRHGDVIDVRRVPE